VRDEWETQVCEDLGSDCPRLSGLSVCALMRPGLYPTLRCPRVSG
jgi:hypothetical protein